MNCKLLIFNYRYFLFPLFFSWKASFWWSHLEWHVLVQVAEQLPVFRALHTLRKVRPTQFDSVPLCKTTFVTAFRWKGSLSPKKTPLSSSAAACGHFLAGSCTLRVWVVCKQLSYWLLNLNACDNSHVKINIECGHQSRTVCIHALYLRKDKKNYWGLTLSGWSFSSRGWPMPIVNKSINYLCPQWS